MDQYPGTYDGESSNYSYNYGIFLDCDPNSNYIRGYDDETRHISFKDCKNCDGCDSISVDKKKNKEEGAGTTMIPGKERFESAPISPSPRPIYIQQPTTRIDDVNNRYNMIIIFMLALVIVLLLINNNNRQNHSSVVYLPQQPFMNPAQIST